MRMVHGVLFFVGAIVALGCGGQAEPSGPTCNLDGGVVDVVAPAADAGEDAITPSDGGVFAFDVSVAETLDSLGRIEIHAPHLSRPQGRAVDFLINQTSGQPVYFFADAQASAEIVSDAGPVDIALAVTTFGGGDLIEVLSGQAADYSAELRGQPDTMSPIPVGATGTIHLTVWAVTSEHVPPAPPPVLPFETLDVPFVVVD